MEKKNALRECRAFFIRQIIIKLLIKLNFLCNKQKASLMLKIFHNSFGKRCMNAFDKFKLFGGCFFDAFG